MSPEEFVQRFPTLRQEAIIKGRKLIITATPNMIDWVSVPEKIRYNDAPLKRNVQYTCNGPDIYGYEVEL
jgi:hypothetical protein